MRSQAERVLRKSAPGRVAFLFGIATGVVVATVFLATRLFGLPDWVWVGSAGLMAIGFPIVMYTSRIERKRAKLAQTGELRFVAPPAHHELFTWRRAITGGALALGALAFAATAFAAYAVPEEMRPAWLSPDGRDGGRHRSGSPARAA